MSLRQLSVLVFSDSEVVDHKKNEVESVGVAQEMSRFVRLIFCTLRFFYLH